VSGQSHLVGGLALRKRAIGTGIVAMPIACDPFDNLPKGHMFPIKYHEPLCGATVGRKMIHLAWLAAAIYLVLLGLLLASFSGLMPAWVSRAVSGVPLLVTLLPFGRAASLRKRLRTGQER